MVSESVSDWKDSVDGAGGDIGKVSPEAFDQFSRVAQTAAASVPGFTVDATGHLDKYSDGSVDVHVWIAAMSEADASLLAGQLGEQIDSRFTSKTKSKVTINGVFRFRYSGSPPEEQGLMVHQGGYAVFLQANDKSVDLQDLLMRYADNAAVFEGEAGDEVTN